MITELLDNVALSPVEYKSYENAMIDLHLLGRALRACTLPAQVIPYLFVELTGRKRSSVIVRIYGRYRKLLPNQDLDALFVWADNYGKSRKAN